MSETSDLDRISDLPDQVRRQILSLLTTRKAISTSLLSRAWKDEWLHLPCLDLGGKFYRETMGYSNPKAWEIFPDYVDKVLERRTLTLKHGNWSSLQKLCFYMPSISVTKTSSQEFKSRVDRWLDYAVCCLKIKELEITSYYYPERYKLPKHIMKAANSLTSLSLTCVKLDQDIINTIASTCSLLEFLRLIYCRTGGMSRLKLSGFDKLQEVQFCKAKRKLTMFQIDSMTLQTFSFFEWSNSCEINVASCSSLKYLQIHGSRLTRQSLTCHLAHLSNLQELDLENCQSLTYVNISNHGLKHLSLKCMNKLVGVEIDAVDLKNFTYSHGAHHPLPFFTFKDFNSEKMTVNTEHRLIESLYDDKISNFIGQLYQCSRYLKTHATLNCDTIWKTDLKEQKFPPLYYVKHLTIETKDFRSYAACVDNLLCLFPRSEMVLFNNSYQCLSKRTPLMLKLKYKKEVDDQDTYEHHWWHQLLEVTIEHIEGFEECIIAHLKDFFENKRVIKKIVVHVVDKGN